MTTNRQILLASRPVGPATLTDFRAVDASVPALDEGQVLVRNHWLSIDPYMRGRMNEGKSYAAPQPLGKPMIGQTAGEVIESRSPSWQVGDHVVAMGGWQQLSIFDGNDRRTLRKIDTSVVPMSAWLGAVGMPGVTAWYGVAKILETKPGQTVVVSAAAGAVGMVVGQLAKIRGARAVGIAGGPAKCKWVMEELGFDACIDHRAHQDSRSLASALKEVCPDGIDGDFENVGGKVLDAVLVRMNAFGRVALCGMIAGYDGAPVPMEMAQLLLVSRLRIEGFIVTEHPEVWPEALRELGELFATGKLRYREAIADGIDAAPQALLDVLAGRNFGKQLVRI
jgi:NADPH-dependent curcumin reductase CurA